MLKKFPSAFWLNMSASLLFFAGLLSLLPVLPVYSLEIGLDAGAFGLSVTVTSFVAVAFRVFGGSLADRFGRKGVMHIGGVALSLGSLMFLFIPSLAGLLIGRALQGVAVGLFTTAYKALVVDLSPAGSGGQAIGIGNLSFAGGLIFASPLGEWIQIHYGFAPVFMLSAAIGLLALVPVTLVNVKGYVPSTRSMIQSTKRVLPLHSMTVGLWAMLSVASMFAGISVFLPLLAEDRHLVGVGLAFSMFAAASLIAEPLGGSLGDRFGRRAVTTPGVLIGIAGLAVAVLAYQSWMLLVAGTLIGFGNSLARVNVDAIVLNGAPMDQRGTAAGLQYAAGDTWVGLLSWGLGALLVHTDYAIVFGLLGSISLVVMVFIWMFAPRQQSAAGTPASAK